MQAIYDGLRWLGLEWDEGPLTGGDCGPYFQSERNAIYERHLEKLRASGHLYDDAGAVRFRSLRKTQVVDDMVCGRIEFDLSNAETHPDMTIRRPDRSWIFHFVNVVDDIEMKITHVIRGEDHLSNTPKHLELYEALGAAPPRFAHIPLILNKDGTKMSKRDQGASVDGYIEGGYVPEAVRNFLCLLGWSPKDDREKMEIAEVVERFEPASINRKPAHFDLEKCDWLNQQYILQMPLESLADRVEPWLKKAGVNFDSRAGMLPVLALVRERLKRLSDAPAWMDYFFTGDYAFDPEAVRNFLCLLGWSPKDDREKMEIAEVIERFDPANINRKPAHFDLEKCDWLNQQYILQMPLESLADRVEPWLKKAGVNFDSRTALLPVLALVRERLKRLSDAPAWMDYFFTGDYAFDPEAVGKVFQKPGAIDRLRTLASAYEAAAHWTAIELETILKAKAAETGAKVGEFVHPARVAVTGRTVGASLYHTFEVMGRERVLARFQRALAKFAT